MFIFSLPPFISFLTPVFWNHTLVPAKYCIAAISPLRPAKIMNDFLSEAIKQISFGNTFNPA